MVLELMGYLTSISTAELDPRMQSGRGHAWYRERPLEKRRWRRSCYELFVEGHRPRRRGRVATSADCATRGWRGSYDRRVMDVLEDALSRPRTPRSSPPPTLLQEQLPSAGAHDHRRHVAPWRASCAAWGSTDSDMELGGSDDDGNLSNEGVQ